MTCTLLTDQAEVRAIEPQWDELARRLPFGTAFNHPAWALSWWRLHEHDGFEWRCVVRYDDSVRMTGVVPLVRCPDGLIRFAAHDLVDFAAALTASDDLAPLWADTARLLAEHDGTAEVHLPTLADDDLAALEAGDLGVRTTGTDAGVRIPLTADYESFLTALNRSSRRNVRAAERNLATDVGPVTLSVTDDPATCRDAVRTLCLMREDAWRRRGRLHELHPSTTGDGFQAFLAAFAHAGSGIPAVATLRAGPHRVGMALLLRHHPVLAYYSFGYAADFAAYSPGMVLLARGVRYAIDNGYSVLDLGRGEEWYKFRLGGVRYVRQDVVLAV